MKILYAVQATGNGHISRAIQLMPYLEQYGEVDIFLSGNNCHLQSQLPVKYRSKGLSLFYGNKGGLDYLKMWKELSLKRIWNEAKELPVEKYDLVINDFESITSLACKLKKKKSIQFGHQASFQSSLTPRPKKKDLFGEISLKIMLLLRYMQVFILKLMMIIYITPSLNQKSLIATLPIRDILLYIFLIIL